MISLDKMMEDTDVIIKYQNSVLIHQFAKNIKKTKSVQRGFN